MIDYTQDISELPWSSGIYIIRNKINGKVYIGKASGRDGIRGRVREHFWELRTGRHKNQHLKRAWDFYGQDSWEFTVLELCEKSECGPKEVYYIHQYDSYNRDKGYNKGKSDGITFQWSDEQREKFKEKMTGRKLPKEWSEAISRGKKGRTPIYSSEENRQNSLKGLEQGRTPEVWKKSAEIRRKSWRLTSPTGDSIIVDNLKQFCKEYRLRYNSMIQIANGYIKIYKGWICQKY